MNCNVKALTFLMVAASLLSADDKKNGAEKPATNKDLAKLAGKWQPVSVQMGKEKLKDAQIKTMTLVMEGETYKVTLTEEKGAVFDKGTIKIDAKAKPMTMDIKGVEGPNKGKSMLCIYEFDGENLRICYDTDGKKRPTEFKADGDKIMLAVYKRVKS